LTSTHDTEFREMKAAVEELISVRYMLQCLCVKVLHVSGDNLGVIQNCTMKDSLMKKKHTVIAYHTITEAATSGIGHPIKTPGTMKYTDCLTKCQTLKCFASFIGGMMTG
jgi:hypothetical protein